MDISKENLKNYIEADMDNIVFDLYKQEIDISLWQNCVTSDGDWDYKNAIIKCKGVSSFSYIYGYSTIGGGVSDEMAAIEIEKIDNIYSLVLYTEYSRDEGTVQIKCLELEEIK